MNSPQFEPMISSVNRHFIILTQCHSDTCNNSCDCGICGFIPCVTVMDYLNGFWIDAIAILIQILTYSHLQWHTGKHRLNLFGVFWNKIILSGRKLWVDVLEIVSYKPKVGKYDVHVRSWLNWNNWQDIEFQTRKRKWS